VLQHPQTPGNRDRRTRRPSAWALVPLALLGLLAWAGVALGQGVPGGPDLPPPDSAPPAATPSRPSSPAPSSPAPSSPAPSTQSPSTPQAGDSGPTPEELAARRAAAEERARQREEARQRALARERALAAARARAERAREFQGVTGFTEARFSLADDLSGTLRSLDSLIVTASVALPSDATPEPAGGADHGATLSVMLLIASALSALLVVIPMLIGRLTAAERVPVTGAGRVQTYMSGRMSFVQSHRVELAGISVGCLLIALLIQIGAI
jgi:hypothetical protein